MRGRLPRLQTELAGPDDRDDRGRRHGARSPPTAAGRCTPSSIDPAVFGGHDAEFLGDLVTRRGGGGAAARRGPAAGRDAEGAARSRSPPVDGERHRGADHRAGQAPGDRPQERLNASPHLLQHPPEQARRLAAASGRGERARAAVRRVRQPHRRAAVRASAATRAAMRHCCAWSKRRRRCRIVDRSTDFQERLRVLGGRLSAARWRRPRGACGWTCLVTPRAGTAACAKSFSPPIPPWRARWRAAHARRLGGPRRAGSAAGARTSNRWRPRVRGQRSPWRMRW